MVLPEVGIDAGMWVWRGMDLMCFLFSCAALSRPAVSLVDDLDFSIIDRHNECRVNYNKFLQYSQTKLRQN